MTIVEHKFKDLLSNIVDNRGRTCPTSKSGTALIATNCIKNEELYPVFENVRWVDDETMESWFRSHPLPGDILFVTKGSPGRCCLVPDPVDFCIAQDMVAIRADKEIIHPDFLLPLLRSSTVQHNISNMHVGTLIPHFKKGDFDKLYIRFPKEKVIQEAIGNFYLKISRKIALNRKLNETLEGMARALFQSWFVDFDPVKAKLAAVRHGRDPGRACMAALSGKLRIPPGKPKVGTPTSSSASFNAKADEDVGAPSQQLPTAGELDAAITALDNLSEAQRNKLAQTASHFPATFQESELGLIPEGWEVGEIGKEVSVLGGATPSTKEERFWNGENAWATPKDLSGLPSKVLISTERQITNEGVAKISSGQLPAGTVLMSSRAPVGYLALATIPISINQGFIAMVCDKTLPNTFILLWAESVMDEIKSNASGSTFAEISKKAFCPIQVIIPDRTTLSLFDQTVSGIYQEITSNEHQSRTLAELRDTLLPKLLSGELSVGKAQKAVEAVVES